MTHVPLNNQRGLNQNLLKDGIIFGDREGAPDRSVTDNNVFFAVIGGSGRNTLFITRGREGDVVKWSIDNPYELSAITAKGLSTREEETPPVYGSLGAQFITHYAGHLVLADTKETSVSADGTKTEYFPYRVRWSAYADPENFSGDTDSNAGFADLLGDEANAAILSMFPLRDIVVAYKSNSIYTLTPGRTTADELFISADLVVETKGILSAKAVAPVFDANRHLIICPDNFYIFDGFQIIDPQFPTGERIREYFFKNLDYSKADSLFAVSFPSRSEYWIFFETIGHNREAICWNWEDDSWTRHENLPMRCARSITSIAGGEDILFAGAMDKKTADPAESAGGNTDHQGIVRLFGEQTDLYVRDRLNRVATGVDEETIEGTVDLPATPLIVKSKKGEDMGVRMRRQSLKSLKVEMDVGLPDINDSGFDETLTELIDNDRVQAFIRESDNLTLPVTKKETAMKMVTKEDEYLESNRYIFVTAGDDDLTNPTEYIGVSLRFASPGYLEELGQIIEELSEFEPYDKSS